MPPLPASVAIYGWHKADGKPIQPLYTGHADYYADYSHGIRLVQLALTVEINDVKHTVPEVLANPELAPLLSDEGVIAIAAYPKDFLPRPPSTTSATATGVIQICGALIDASLGNNLASAFLFIAGCVTEPATHLVALPDFKPAQFGEQILAYTNDAEAKILIDAPTQFARGNKVKLIFYALPNGNTTAQTIGKKMEPGDNIHYDIQHIGAQTRFLRHVLTNTTLVVVYLEAADSTIARSWPTWRKNHAAHPGLIPQLIDSVKARFKGFDVRVTLSSHSGGGSFIFGYLNTQTNIPSDIERIAFLDSDYAYDAKLGHAEKLLKWLRASDHHYLSVLAYNDAIAELDGKHFVSANGGTWGRTHAMLDDFGRAQFHQPHQRKHLETYTAP